MATISVWGYVVACDPGCNNISSYHGTIDTADILPDQDLTYVIEDPWWRSSINHRFGKLTFVEQNEEGVILHYGVQDLLVPFNQTKTLEQVGLSYAYAELTVKVEP